MIQGIFSACIISWTTCVLDSQLLHTAMQCKQLWGMSGEYFTCYRLLAL